MRIYNVDLTVTNACNFRCKYCFEESHFTNDQFGDVELFVKKMNELLDSDFFKSNYDLLNIGFWGGEPTLNHKALSKIVRYYEKNEKVKFFIFSNGYSLWWLYPLLEEFKDNYIGKHPKLCTQISYDGQPVHDMYRLRADGAKTGSIVRSTIESLNLAGVPYVIKSTITPESFKHLKECYLDVRDLYENGKDNFRNTQYFPTIDYYHLGGLKPEQVELFDNQLKKSLVEIAREEAKFHEENGILFFAWFKANKALCSAGRDLVAIDHDGKLYKCHGVLYGKEKDKHYITKLQDEEFINKIEESHNFHSKNFNYQPRECLECIASICTRCNAIKFEESEKEDYLEKWRDYCNQPTLCRFMKTSGKVAVALKRILGGRK